MRAGRSLGRSRVGFGECCGEGLSGSWWTSHYERDDQRPGPDPARRKNTFDSNVRFFYQIIAASRIAF